MTKVEVYKSGGSGCRNLFLIALVVTLVPVICLCAAIIAAVNGIFGDVETKTASYSEAMQGAESVQVELAVAVGEIHLNALDGDSNLFEADVTYIGDLEFNTDGASRRHISLRQVEADTSFWDFLQFFSLGEDLRWEIGLNPDVPLQMDISSGVGSSSLDLRPFQLDELNVAAGVGGLNITLPEPEQSYHVVINGGVGSIEITLPEGAAVRLEAVIGVGSIDVPGYLERQSDDSTAPGVSSVWETANFNGADFTITVVISGGVGGITLR